MKSNLSTLPTARRGTVFCQEAGVVFPQLFRITGHPFKFKEGKGAQGCILESSDDIEPDFNSFVEPTYTLDSAMTYSNLAESFITPINKLQHDVDGEWWVVVRHHASKAALDGYVDAMCDTRTMAFEGRWMTFNTQFGIFSILRRPPTVGAPTGVLIYKTQIISPLGPMDWCKIIDSSGNELTEDDLESPEDQEHFAPLNKILNPA
jgi:hypothetical protein